MVHQAGSPQVPVLNQHHHLSLPRPKTALPALLLSHWPGESAAQLHRGSAGEALDAGTLALCSLLSQELCCSEVPHPAAA